MRSLNSVGRVYRVGFESDLLSMNAGGWEMDVPNAKVAGIRRLQERGLRIVAVVDNEPVNLQAMAHADETGEILFLHADTIFESQREALPGAVAGSTYDLAGLVRESDLRTRVEFIWHGVNDEANLRQFLASDVHWAECDVRRDPLDRLVLRHDSFIETPWTRSEHPFFLRACLEAIARSGRGIGLDLKEGDSVIEQVMRVVEEIGLEPQVAFFGCISALHSEGIRRISQRFPDSTMCVPVDFLAPLVAASPESAMRVLGELRSWGVNRVALDWTAPGISMLLDHLAADGWDVNIYGVPDLESFLEASLLLPRAVTADFNFPGWNYYGRGSGRRRAYHRYDLVVDPARHNGRAVP